MKNNKTPNNVYKLLFNAMRDCVVIYKAIDNGKNFEFIDINPSVEKSENISKSKIIGKKVTDVFPAIVEFGLFDVLKKVLKTGKSMHFPLGFYDDGRVAGWRENYVYKIDDEHIVAIYLDTTKEKQAQSDLKLSAKVFETSQEGILITDKDAKVIKANDAFYKMSGYGEKEILKKKAKVLKSGIHPKQFYENMWFHIKKDGKWEGEIWNRRRDGSSFAVYLTISVIYDDMGEVKNYIGVYLDITEKKKIQNDIQRLAYFDTLTKLANRSQFHDELQRYIQSAKRGDSNFAIMFINLDNFKMINDSFGHRVGDLLLIEVAKILKKNIRDTDFAARLSGDEFIILCKLKDDSKSDVGDVATRIIDELQKTIFVEENEITTGGSIGIASYPEDGQDAEALLKSADVAMHEAKKNGKNNFFFHTREMFEEYQYNLKLGMCLKNAILRDEFEMYYQPKISPYDKKVVGAESLIRWNSPTLGRVPPLEFISFAEENGLIIEIGNIVIDKTLQFIKSLASKGYDIKVSLNISSVQLQEADFVENLINTIDKYECPVSMIELEITESKIMQNVDNNILTLNKLKNLGIDISIDDFGTGYSSMSYLQKLPVNVLKIDKSFIDNVEKSKDGATLIEGIISLTKALSLTTVAEGVENCQQVEFLKNINCDLIQGYIYSKPLNQNDFLEYLKKP